MTLADFGDLGLLALALAGWLGREGISRWRRPARGRLGAASSPRAPNPFTPANRRRHDDP